MRPHYVWVILRKEFLEALRDRRTLFILIVLPILLYPLLVTLISRLQESQEAEQKARASKVALWGELPAEVRQRLEQDGKLVFAEWTGAPPALKESLATGALAPPAKPPLALEADDSLAQKPKEPDTEWTRVAQAVLLGRTVDAVLIPWSGFSKSLEGGAAAKASILYDAVRPDSMKAQERLADALRLYRRDVLERRERAMGLKTGFTDAIEIVPRNVAGESRRAGLMLGMILPYLLILLSASGGLYAAIDMTAGEKERGTMQTLLCAPIDSLEIIAGKFMAVWGISTMATLINLASLAVTFTSIKMIPGVSMTVNPVSALLAFVLLMPVSMMVSALFVAVGAFAKDFKEGQAYLTPILMFLIFPLVATMLPGTELNAFLSFVPIMNSALLVRNVFLGDWHADMLFLTVISSLCYAMLTLVFAARVYERNTLLLGGKDSVASLLEFTRKPGDKPSAGISLFVFSIVLVVTFYGSLALRKQGIATTLAIVEYGFFLLPAILFAQLKGYNLKETFSLRVPGWKGLAGSILIGLSAWTVAAGLFVRLFPPPESFTRALQKVVLMEDQPVPLSVLFLLISFSPAFCEEALFRGLILSGFRRLGMWPAILATAFLFGIAHASIYRLLPVMALGTFLGYTVWKTRSIFAGMVVHMLNNALVVAMAKIKSVQAVIGLRGSEIYLPWSYIATGALVAAIGIALIASERDASRASPEPAQVPF
ncbi:MAG: ABC transporter permease subunit/CPBP intramembrane protease [Bryobacteraceae bacterium]|jgi:sodium transport system permease protein